MKAYYLHMKDDDDAGGEIVFANTAREAKKQAYGYDFYSMSGEWIYLRVNRYPQFDNMEHLTERELRKEQWRAGWWFHESGCPDSDEAEDEEFYEWYDKVYGS